MLLDWKYDVNTKVMRLDIRSYLYYVAIEGGRTINKFVNGQLEKTFIYVEKEDEWLKEITWLSDNCSDVVGIQYVCWEDGYLNREGKREGYGIHRGNGVVSVEKPISIDRLGIPANIQEWWDWEDIALGPNISEDTCFRGIIWKRNKLTGEIVRTSRSNGPMPNLKYPIIHGPYSVDITDIDKNNGWVPKVEKPDL